MDFKAFSITIRLRDTYCLTDSDLSWFISQFKSRTKLKDSAYIYCITEKKDVEKHLHIAMFYDTATEKGKVHRYFARKIEARFDQKDYLMSKALRVDIMYNADWLNQYLKKQDDTDVIFTLLPDDWLSYLPSEEQQVKWKEKSFAGDKFFHNLKVEFTDWSTDDLTFYQVAQFMAWREHPKGGNKQVIRNSRIAQQTTVNLWWYLQPKVTAGHVDKFIDYGVDVVSPLFLDVEDQNSFLEWKKYSGGHFAHICKKCNKEHLNLQDPYTCDPL